MDAENSQVVHPGFDTENLTMSHLFQSQKPASLSLSQRTLGKQYKAEYVAVIVQCFSNVAALALPAMIDES